MQFFVEETFNTIFYRPREIYLFAFAVLELTNESLELNFGML
jgi:hypothetical protein